jgi:hypothetical protein
MTALVIAGALCLLAGVVLTLWGVWALVQQFRKPSHVKTHEVELDGHGKLTVEPGVLLNTLWAHLPNAECQAGECGGCKVELVSGRVKWIQEPTVEINRATHALACSCVPLTDVRCRVVT